MLVSTTSGYPPADTAAIQRATHEPSSFLVFFFSFFLFLIHLGALVGLVGSLSSDNMNMNGTGNGMMRHGYAS